MDGPVCDHMITASCILMSQLCDVVCASQSLKDYVLRKFVYLFRNTCIMVGPTFCLTLFASRERGFRLQGQRQHR